MTLFFSTSAPDFKARWKIVREKGFLWFYAHSALRWAAFIVLMQAGSFLVRRRFPVWEDLAGIAAVAALFCLAMPPVQWKKYESGYKRKIRRHKNA